MCLPMIHPFHLLHTFVLDLRFKTLLLRRCFIAEYVIYFNRTNLTCQFALLFVCCIFRNVLVKIDVHIFKSILLLLRSLTLSRLLKFRCGIFDRVILRINLLVVVNPIDTCALRVRHFIFWAYLDCVI